MNILGIKITKQGIIIFVVVILLLLVLSLSKRGGIRNDRKVEDLQPMQTMDTSVSDELSYSELMQREYIKAWGEPPEGFRWGDDKTLVAVSSEELNGEEVLYSWLRGVSVLDFSTVEKYTYSSTVVNTFKNYFNSDSYGSVDYYTQFLRKVYKLVALSLEVDEVKNAAVMSNGTMVYTVKVKVLDLRDKDVWRAEQEKLFSDLLGYVKVERDSTKLRNYVYDYIYSLYESGRVGKREATVEIRLDKLTRGGWLVADDTDLDMLFRYEDGVNVAEYILEEFQSYVEYLENEEYKNIR